VISEVTITGPGLTWLWIPILLEQLREYTIYLGTLYLWIDEEREYLYMRVTVIKLKSKKTHSQLS